MLKYVYVCTMSVLLFFSLHWSLLSPRQIPCVCKHNKALSDSDYCSVLKSVMSDLDFSSSVSFDLSEIILIC